MVECPICGVMSQQDQASCGVCGLPTDLFEEFREVAISPTSEESAVTDGTAWAPPQPARTEPPDSNPRLPTTAHRPVAPPSGRPVITVAAPEPEPPRPLKPTPANLPSLRMDAEEIEGVRQRVISWGTSAQLTRRRRELIGSVLEALIDRYRRLCDRRDVFSSVVRTQALDAELAAYRKALGRGEIKLAADHRRKAQRLIQSVEAVWVRISGQIAQANEMIRILRELGGVAPSVLRPIAAAVQVPRRAEAAQIERRLAHANALIWKLLAPRLEHEVSKSRTHLSRFDAADPRVPPIRLEIDRLGEKIDARRIADVLEARRFLRAEMATLTSRPSRRPSGRFTIDQTHPS